MFESTTPMINWTARNTRTTPVTPEPHTTHAEKLLMVRGLDVGLHYRITEVNKECRSMGCAYPARYTTPHDGKLWCSRCVEAAIHYAENRR